MIQIRIAVRADAVALLDLLQAIGWFAWINEATPERALERVRQQLDLALADDSHTIYIAHTDGRQVVGYLAVHWLPYLILAGPEGFVSELFVRAEARGQGVGGQLLRRVTDEARQRGCARLSLLNMQDRESYRRGFYRQHDWDERPEARNFILWLTRP